MKRYKIGFWILALWLILKYISDHEQLEHCKNCINYKLQTFN